MVTIVATIMIMVAYFLVLYGVVGLWDGVRNDFSYLQFFGRFLFMLYVMELYDIIFFDWILLCNSNFFPHFYPELKGVVGPHMFGYNMKSHILHFIIYIPVCAVIAGICMLIAAL